ncbi:MAG: translocation/assembly module TamB domain-containing protein, partial [Bacteroidota bacterium]
VEGNLQVMTPPNRQKAVVRGNLTLSDGIIGLAPAGVVAGPMRALSSRFPSPDLEIQAAIGRNLRFRGSGVNTPLEPNPQAMRVVGTPQRPAISGSLMARGGTTNLPTATLRLSSFGVNYTIEPEPLDHGDPVALRVRGRVDGLAQTRISSIDQPIDIDVAITGSLPDQITVHTTSTPALTEAQIYALLGGVPFTQLPGIAGRDQNLTQMVSAQFLATLANAFRLRLFQPIEEEIQRLLGLSELSVYFAFDQPVTLQVGKYVLRDLLVSYEQPVVANAQMYDLRVSYVLPGGLRITYHNDERNDQRIEVGYNFTF